MSWPFLIELHDSNYSIAYNGSEVVETWYIEPYDAITAFVSSCIGKIVDNGQGKQPTRTMPASHFLYPWMLATKCDVVPYDPRSFSYMGGTQYQQPQNVGQPEDGMTAITTAISGYKTGAGANRLNPTANIDFNWMNQSNKNYSAGAFVAVTYKPILMQRQPTSGNGINPGDMDFVNYKLTGELRENKINAGLKIITPRMLVNMFGVWNMFYPASGVAPVMSEEYEVMTVERRMMNPSMSISNILYYINCTNAGIANVPVVNVTWPDETVLFKKMDQEFVYVPTVDISGEPNGWNMWINLKFTFHIRTLWSDVVHDLNGDLKQNPSSPGWNHILVYPGTLSWLNGQIPAQTPSGLGWYQCRYSANSVGVDSKPYPNCNGAFGIVQGPNGPANGIFDVLTQWF